MRTTVAYAMKRGKSDARIRETSQNTAEEHYLFIGSRD
jgi:hypothetical protein